MKIVRLLKVVSTVQPYSLHDMLKFWLRFMRLNSQHCWANNVESCCVSVGSGVQTDATTPNYDETCSASWKDTIQKTLKPCLMRVRCPNNDAQALAFLSRLKLPFPSLSNACHAG